MTVQHATIMKDPCYERMGVQALPSGQHQWNAVRAPARIPRDYQRMVRF